MNLRTVILLFHLIGIFIAPLSAQQNKLKRQASLGIRFQAVSDSLAKVYGLQKTHGLLLLSVIEGSTADNLGLKEEDIIIRFNGTEVNQTQDLLRELNAVKEEDEISLAFYRNGIEKQVRGKAMGKPLEQSDWAEVSYESFQYSGNHLRSILHKPKGVKKPPLVFFIQGYPCQSIDMVYTPQQASRRLIDDWVQAGYAVYRIEKPGMGDSESEKPCLELNFLEEVEAFRQGYKNLKNRKDIDLERLFLFGHSIGGIVAPLLAAEFNPKGIVTYGTVVNTWFEYMQELSRVQGVFFNRSDSLVEADIRNATPFWYQMLVEQKTNQEILTDQEIYKMLEEEGTLESFKQGQFINRHYSYWASIQNLALSEKWGRVKTNVLALYGEFDIQALNSDHIYAIERIVNRNHPQKAKAKIIKEADHGFVRFPSMQENVEVLNNNQYWSYMQNNYHDGIAKITVKWMNELK